MPSPIRPVKDSQEGSQGIIFQDPYSIAPLSDIQRMVLDQASTSKKEAGKNSMVSQKTKEAMYDIWKTKDQDDLVTAQKAMGSTDLVYRVPTRYSNSDIIRMVHEGMVYNKGNRLVAFTERGKLVLGREIMAQSNEFKKNKTKDKFIFSQNVKEDALNVQTIMPEIENRLKPVIEDINERANTEIAEQNSQLYHQVVPKVMDEGAMDDQLASAIADTLQENMMRQSSKNKAKFLITAALKQADPDKHGHLIEKLSSFYSKVETGEVDPNYIIELISG